MSALDYALLIGDYFSRDIRDYTREDLHIFTLFANEWILHLNYRTESIESRRMVRQVINKLAKVAEYALRTKTRNCGCYFDLPWLPSLWSARAQHFHPDINYIEPYLRLVHVLERLHPEGLLTGSFMHLLPGLSSFYHGHYPTLCNEPECNWSPGTVQQPVTICGSVQPRLDFVQDDITIEETTSQQMGTVRAPADCK